MTGREFLQAIYESDMRIRSLEDELATASHALDGLSGMRYDKDKVDGGEPPDLADKLARLMDLRRNINLEWDGLVEQRAKARLYISEMAHHRYAVILTERYLCGKSWRYIAHFLHLEKRWVFDLHKDALAEFDAIFQKYSIEMH